MYHYYTEAEYKFKCFTFITDRIYRHPFFVTGVPAQRPDTKDGREIGGCPNKESVHGLVQFIQTVLAGYGLTNGSVQNYKKTGKEGDSIQLFYTIGTSQIHFKTHEAFSKYSKVQMTNGPDTVLTDLDGSKDIYMLLIKDKEAQMTGFDLPVSAETNSADEDAMADPIANIVHGVDLSLAKQMLRLLLKFTHTEKLNDVKEDLPDDE